MGLDLSVIITARNEEFLKRTVEGVLKAREANTNVIINLDGEWAKPPLKDHDDVIIVYHGKAIGQRAGMNQAIRLSKAKYIMKLDAHCIVGQGFDRILVESAEKMDKKVTQVPEMYNLHAFDWKCKKCGNRWYQSPTPTYCQNEGEKRGKNKNCDSKEFERVIVWEPRKNRRSTHYRFDKDLHFQYWNGLRKRKGFEGDITETMSLLGACFFMNRKWYWELGGSDEDHGSWGQQGTEIACKTWLSGGRLVTNRKTWFSHLFRTQGGDFTFPYPQSGNQVANARKHSKDMWRNNKWEKAIHKLDWLIEKFKPVPGWHDASKGIIFYTDNTLPIKMANKVKKNLLKASGGLKIVSCSLKPIDFGENIHLPLKRGWITLNKQILKALEKIDTDIVFFCEHDVLYHKSHFQFEPKHMDRYYYNTNVWKVRLEDGHGYRVDDCKQLSGMVCNRKLAIKHFKKRLEMLESFSGDDFNKFVRRIGFEPGTHNREERVDDYKAEGFESRRPNLDLRHGGNSTRTKWKPEQFRNKKYTKGWTETNMNMPGWNYKILDELR